MAQHQQRELTWTKPQTGEGILASEKNHQIEFPVDIPHCQALRASLARVSLSAPTWPPFPEMQKQGSNTSVHCSGRGVQSKSPPGGPWQRDIPGIFQRPWSGAVGTQ
ncbi:uncharacterized protein PV07_05920 [Cladophialophora immunda]|uniref:Uncharacterized protein n=1 Tax=Cladophialophora immunda TaxID=569365 RepID=A0A0D1ZQ65_9EURO|nr:uncharacterized protein PV07_05920 [Cladophialophora immunda]KIW30151.1 hypothetical protein PV07_05920 [Cladophialophora immunda]OQU95901.1 hypothetical protein CLAIMM_02060 isoform 2 [Cladophialophora immunda]